MSLVMPSLSLVLPLPPSINSQYATVNGRRVLSAEARHFKRDVERLIERKMIDDVLTDKMLATMKRTYLSLFIDFFFASPHKRDLDGGLKITQDALCEALGINDNRVVDIHLVKRIDPLHPRAEVTIEAIADWRFDTEYFVIEETP